MSLPKHNKVIIKNKELEKGWNQRFVLNKIPPYDAFKDPSYLNLGLMKSKMKYEEALEKEKLKTQQKPFANYRYPKHYEINTVNKKSNPIDKIKFSTPDVKLSNKDNNKNKFSSTTYNYRNIGDNFVNYRQELVDDERQKEFDKVKQLWENFGVDINFQNGFIENLKNLKSEKDALQFLKLEKRQMQKFQTEISTIIKNMFHRKDEISNLKKLLKILEQTNMNSNLDADLQNANEYNKNKIQDDIDECLSSIRINTINLVNQIKNFLISNSFYLLSGKINTSKANKDFRFVESYIASIRNDMDFLENSFLVNLYDMKNFENEDPFLLSISELEKDNCKNEKEENLKKLKINENLLSEIQNCLFFINQIELINQIKSINNFFFDRNEHSKSIPCFPKFKNENLNPNNKGNFGKNFYKLKTTKYYKNTFFNTINFNNLPFGKAYIVQNKNKNKYELKKNPMMTSSQLVEQFLEYDKMKKLMSDDENEKFQNNIEQKEEDRKRREKEERKRKEEEEERKRKEEEERKKREKEERKRKEEEERKKREEEERKRKEEKDRKRREEEERKRREEEEERKRKEEEDRKKREEEERKRKEEEERIKREEEEERIKREEEEEERIKREEEERIIREPSDRVKESEIEYRPDEEAF